MLKALSILALLLVTACSEAPKMLAACDSGSPGRICEVQNPEDMDLLPSGDWLVFSEMLSEVDPKNLIYGSLSALHLESGKIIPLFGKGVANWPNSELAELGDESCPGKPDPTRFGGHGIDVRALDDGTILLAAVNHGDRESIELFSIDMDSELPIATWRGCIFPKQTDLHNDVAIAADGRIYFTRFLAHPHNAGFSKFTDMFRLMTGGDNGFVYQWSKSNGLRVIPNSGGNASNGISISGDDQNLFIAEWGKKSLYRLNLKGEEVTRDEIELEVAPDNFSWGGNGKLIVTGQKGNVLSVIRCLETKPTTCDVEFGIYEIDSKTLTVSEMHKGTGAASVALLANNQLYIGNFAGDNIEKHEFSQ